MNARLVRVPTSSSGQRRAAAPAAGRLRVASGPASLLALQRQAGNAAVAQLLRQRPEGRHLRVPAALQPAPRPPAARPSAPRRPTVQRHSSWEHQLIGDLTPQELAVLGASRDVADPNKKVTVGGKDISAKDVLHVISQEVRRLTYFQGLSSSMRGLKAKEKALQERDTKDDKGNGSKWQVRLVNIPVKKGPPILVTYGELNTLGDYFGSVSEMKKVDPVWLDRLVRGVRASTLKELVKLYAEVRQLKSDPRYKPRRKTAEEKAAQELGVSGLRFRAAPTKSGGKGKDDQLPIGGVVNELKLMGAGPGLGTIVGKKKPTIGKDKSTSYSSTLARNACHFAPESWHAWAEHHNAARKLAKQAAKEMDKADQIARQFRKDQQSKKQDRDYYQTKTQVKGVQEEAATRANEALLVNGFGDHYLQDSYAAGHLINKTQIMQFYVRWLDTQKSKWDAHWDKNWRKAQHMAYGQPGISDPQQYKKSGVSKDRKIDGTQVSSGINPQTVENQRGLDWQTRAKALGLQVPSGLAPGSDSLKVFVAWAQYEFTAKSKHQPLPLSALVALGNRKGMSRDSVKVAVYELFRSSIVRFSDYQPEQMSWTRPQWLHRVNDKTKFVLRQAYIPKTELKSEEIAEKALGVSYKEYMEFMNSSFLQKATNNLHDEFCQKGLTVYAGDDPSVSFKVYGDNNMLQKTASDGLLHSSQTAKMSQQAIEEILDGGPASYSTAAIVKRFPDAVEWKGAKLSLAEWHNDSSKLEAFCASEVFPRMSDVSQSVKSKVAPGLFSPTLGKITVAHPGDLF